MNDRATTRDSATPSNWRGAIALLIVLVVLYGCRVPDPPVFKDKSIGLIYDTSMEDELRSGKAPAIVQTAFERYIDTLAEPVAVIESTEKAWTWEVLVATNRGRFVPGLARADADNRVLDFVQYGRAEVFLPKQVRGQEPKMTAGGKRFGFLPPGKSSSSQPVAKATSDALTDAEFLEAVNSQLGRSRQHDLLVFVHGFNVSFDSAVIRTAQVALDMPFNGAVVAYCWPSQGGVFNYDEDEPINKSSVGPFTQFLTLLRQGVPPETRINIVVHSMGNRIVMQSLSELAEGSEIAASQSANRKPFANVALCAPDVGHADFQAWAPGVVAMADRVSLYSSAGDSALIVSKGLHGERRAGDAWEPAICPGVETIDCSRIDMSFMGHSYYGSNTDVLADLFMLLKEDLPAARRPHLSVEKTLDGAVYYQFSKSAPAIQVGWHFEETEVE